MAKKIVALFLALIMLLSIVACEKPANKEKEQEKLTSSNNSEIVESINSSASDVTSSDTSSLVSSDASEDVSTTSSTDTATQSEDTTVAGDNVLVDNSANVTTPTTTTSTEKVTTTQTIPVEGIIDLDISNKIPVTKNWSGVNAIHQGFMFMPDEYGREYNDDQIAEELRRMEDMDLNMVRSYMDAGYAFVSREGLDVTYDWESDRMKGFYKWLDAMEERDIEVAVNMGWSVGSLQDAAVQKDTSTYVMPWDKVYAYYDKIKIYTDWVEEFIKEVIIKRGYDLEYLVMFTEPYHDREYKFSLYGKPEWVTKNGWDITVDVISATDKALKEAGLRDLVKLTGPQFGISSKFYKGETLEEELKWWIDNIDDFIDVYTVHWYIPTWPGIPSNESASYFDDNYDLWYYYFEEILRIFSETGKPFWFDEWNYGGNVHESQQTDFYPQQIAQTVLAAMNTGIDNVLYWQLFETVWPNRVDSPWEFSEGIHILGVAPSLYTSAIPYKLYYGFSLLAKYCGEMGSTTYLGQGESGVHCSMVEYKKNGKTHQNVIVVNTTAFEQKIGINFEKKIGKNMYRYMFDPINTKLYPTAKPIETDKGFENVNKLLQDTIPAGSIVVYTTVKD